MFWKKVGTLALIDISESCKVLRRDPENSLEGRSRTDAPRSQWDLCSGGVSVISTHLNNLSHPAKLAQCVDYPDIGVGLYSCSLTL